MVAQHRRGVSAQARLADLPWLGDVARLQCQQLLADRNVGRALDVEPGRRYGAAEGEAVLGLGVHERAPRQVATKPITPPPASHSPRHGLRALSSVAAMVDRPS